MIFSIGAAIAAKPIIAQSGGQRVNVKFDPDTVRVTVPTWNNWYLLNNSGSITNLKNTLGVDTGFSVVQTTWYGNLDYEFEPDAPTTDPDFPKAILEQGVYYSPGRLFNGEIRGVNPAKNYQLIFQTYQKNGGDECLTEAFVGGVAYQMGGTYGVLGKVTVPVNNPAGGIIPFQIRPKDNNTAQGWPCFSAFVIIEL